MREALKTYLRTALTNNNIWPGKRAPQGTDVSHINFWKVSTVQIYTHDGFSKLIEARFQFDCKGKKLEDAENLAEAVKGAIDAFHGTMGTVKVASIFVENEGDEYLDPTGWHVVSTDYIVRYYD